jgi:hypothetical protein
MPSRICRGPGGRIWWDGCAIDEAQENDALYVSPVSARPVASAGGRKMWEIIQ